MSLRTRGIGTGCTSRSARTGNQPAIGRFRNGQTDGQADVPAEVWNRLGTKILPKLRAGTDLRIGVDFTVTVSADAASALEAELRQILQDLGLVEAVRLE